MQYGVCHDIDTAHRRRQMVRISPRRVFDDQAAPGVFTPAPGAPHNLYGQSDQGNKRSPKELGVIQGPPSPGWAGGGLTPP